MTTQNELFKQYVARVGGRAEASRRLSIGAGMVGHILCGRRDVSVPVAKAIDADTAGAISRESLRPDVFGTSTHS